jgi:hypothetical protein
VVEPVETTNKTCHQQSETTVVELVKTTIIANPNSYSSLQRNAIYYQQSETTVVEPVETTNKTCHQQSKTTVVEPVETTNIVRKV